MTVASQQGERLNAILTLKNAKGLRYVVPEMLTCRGHEREEKEKGPSAYFRKFVHSSGRGPCDDDRRDGCVRALPVYYLNR